jgi:acetyltransferase-like isoleucine patch superfamily enzyme
MGVAEWIIVALITLPFLNLVWLAIYCRIEGKIDRKRIALKSEEGKAQSEGSAITQQLTKHTMLLRAYKHLNSYLYGWMRYSILLIGRIPSNRCRNWVYRHVLTMKISKRTVISGGCEIRSPWNITAKKCVVATGCVLDGRHGINIGENVVFGANVHVWTEEHDLNDSWFAVTSEHARPVTIDARAWICSDSTILPGVHVGEGAVVATKACVTKDCESFGVYGGLPAKRISERTRDLRYELSGKPHWHFY